MRRLFTILLAIVLASAFSPLNAVAAKTLPIAPATSATTANMTKGTRVFDGFNITILDKTTPATSIIGRTNDYTVMCLVSADGREVGVISYSDYRAIIDKNKKLIRYADGSSLTVPPSGYTKWHDWFADAFNKLRGMDMNSREKAVAAYISKTIEEYRQELIRLVNEERKKVDLTELYADEKAMEYAQVRAKELLVSFSHTRPNGLEKPFEEIGAINENISIGSAPDTVIKSWMDSPGHRANILNDDAFAIGVGCYWSGAGYYWTQEFIW